MNVFSVFEAETVSEFLHTAIRLQLHNVVHLVNITDNRKGTNNKDNISLVALFEYPPAVQIPKIFQA